MYSHISMMSVAKHIQVGKIGEDIACRWLTKQGFAVVERNYRQFLGEIDIVATKTGETYLIEVKTISCKDGQELRFKPEDNLHPMKIKKFYRIAQIYATHKRLKKWSCKAIGILLDTQNKKAKIRWIKL